MTESVHPATAGNATLQGRRRILVIGSGGAGKSTFARGLASRTGLPLIHLDRHYWKAGWVPMPEDEWRTHVHELIRRDSWIMDGNYGGTLLVRIGRCDAVVFFDMPRLVCVKGIVKRWMMSLLKPRPDIAEGCREHMDFSFVRWVWNFQRDSRPRIAAALHHAGPEVVVFRVTRRSEARKLLSSA